VANSITVYSWEEKQPSGRWRRLRWAMTDEDAVAYAERHKADLRKIEGSAEKRTPLPGVMPSATQHKPKR
jgi:hypothetical protein